MDMMLIALLQLYWLSFGFIGLAVLLALRRLERVRRGTFIRYIHDTHPALQVLILWVIGLLTLLPLTVLSYVFQWQLWVVETQYVLLLVASLVMLVWHRGQIRHKFKWPKYTRSAFVLGVVLTVSLLYDFIVSLRLGSPLYGDAPVQLAKVTFFTHVHLALADPFYNNHGVVDPRYSTNLLDALMAIAASLLHTTAAEVWKYSYGIYRLAIWLGMFSMLWSYLDKKYRHLAYLVVALLPVIWSGYFLFAELPDRIVVLWAALLLIGVKLWLETDSGVLLVIAASLIASTHSLFSLISLGYLGLTSVLLVVCKLRPIRSMRAPALGIFVLALPVLLNLSYPNHTNADKAAYVSGAISGTTPVPTHYGLLTISHIPPFPVLDTVLCALFAAYILYAHKQGNKTLRILAYIAACVGFVFAFQPNLLAYVGYGLLICAVRKKSVRVALITLFCYFGLIIYNPVFWHVVGDALPPWVVARFQELNVFSILATLLGTFFLVEWPLKRWGYAKARYGMVVVVVLLFTCYFTWPQTNDYNVTTLSDMKNMTFIAGRQESLDALTQLAPYLHNQTVYSNDPNISIRIPGITPANVYSFNPENESPMTNIALREQCSLQISQNLSLNQLQAAGITRIITDPPYAIPVIRMVKTRSYLKLIAQAGRYQVYAVKAVSATHTADKCAVPFGE